MEIDITIDDPKAYERPFHGALESASRADEELIEFVCNENNKFPSR
jgi:hypothetical protein